MSRPRFSLSSRFPLRFSLFSLRFSLSSRPQPAQGSTRYRQGQRAEACACWLLRLKGYRILGRRVRTPLGEVDVLAQRGRTVALVEVKQRKSLEAAAGSIFPRQQTRLVNAARFILAQQPELGQHTFRFDAVLVNRWGWPRHVANAWGADAGRNTYS